MSIQKNDTPITQEYDSKYDWVKLFLSVFVLAIHAELYPMVLYPWLRIAVPLFFILSSYFVFSKLRNSYLGEHKEIIKKFVFRNLQLYLCWFLILLPVTLYLRRVSYFSNGFFKNILAIIKSALFSSTFVASWFITATIIGFLIIYFLSKLLKNNYWVFIISLFAFCIVTLASSYRSAIAGTFVSTMISKYNNIFGGLVCSYPASLFWIFMGKLIAEQKIKFKSLWLLVCLILCSCIGLFLEWKFVLYRYGSYTNDSYFMLAPFCVFLFLGVQKIAPVYWKSSIYLKRLSTVMYVSHGSILPIVSRLISVFLNIKNTLLSFFITLLCCIAIYIFIEITIKKCRNHRIKKIFKMLY